MKAKKKNDDYVKDAEAVLAAIDGDHSVSDADYIEIMAEIANLADGRANAKREEMEAEG